MKRSKITFRSEKTEVETLHACENVTAVLVLVTYDCFNSRGRFIKTEPKNMWVTVVNHATKKTKVFDVRTEEDCNYVERFITDLAEIA